MQPGLPEWLTRGATGRLFMLAHYLFREDLSVLHTQGQVMTPGVRIYTLERETGQVHFGMTKERSGLLWSLNSYADILTYKVIV